MLNVGQFSMQIMRLSGSVFDANQHPPAIPLDPELSAYVESSSAEKIIPPLVGITKTSVPKIVLMGSMF